jgi:hypothetical protein
VERADVATDGRPSDVGIGAVQPAINRHFKGADMKTLIGTTIVALLCAANARAADQTLTGTISDSICGVHHKDMGKKMSDRECTQMCTARGAQYVLVVDGKIYKLTNHDADLKTHAGHIVNLTGDVKGDTIRVSKIEMPKKN